MIDKKCILKMNAILLNIFPAHNTELLLYFGSISDLKKALAILLVMLSINDIIFYIQVCGSVRACPGWGGESNCWLEGRWRIADLVGSGLKCTESSNLLLRGITETVETKTSVFLKLYLYSSIAIFTSDIYFKETTVEVMALVWLRGVR